MFDALDDKINRALEAYAIPGAAVGIYYQGSEHVRGYGVANIERPEPVTENTLFRIGSTTKTFTGTSIMRLVDAGKLDLDATARTYLPDFATRDPSVAERVTLRQLLNHTAGWLGDDLQDFGRGKDALAKYVASMVELPQLTPVGSTFFYNNAALSLAGHVLEKVEGAAYEKAVQNLLLDPLRLDHTRFFTDEQIGRSFAASHKVVDGKAVLDLSSWYFPRTLNAAGGLISSARDMLSYARFHLGDGKGPDGQPILTAASLKAMHSNPGPGGTLIVELEGMGVTFMLRPSAEGIRIVQHGGNWPGQHSGFFFVPDRDFAFVLLTNSEAGPRLVSELCTDDWVLSRFAGVHNLPATPRVLSDDELADYEGDYAVSAIEAGGQVITITTQLSADQGRLRMRQLGPDGKPVVSPRGTPETILAFYRDDYVMLLDGDSKTAGMRANFVRDEAGRVQWFRIAGRLNQKSRS